MRSFHGRVVALAVLVGTLISGVLVVVSYLWLQRVTDTDARALAHGRVEAIASDVVVREGQVTLNDPPNEALDAVAWVFVDGKLVDGTVPSGVVSTVQTLVSSTGEVNETHDGFLLHAESVPVEGHRVVVVVSLDLEPFRAAAAHGLTLSIGLGAVTVLLGAVLAWFVVRRALRIVHEMAALAQDWGDRDPGRRFDLGRPRDEFGELAHTIDGLLDRVEAAIADERRLTDEIAHELRTPMTALRGEAQLAALSGIDVPPDVVLREVDRLNTAVTTILDAARRRVPGDAGCNLRQALRESIAGRSVGLMCLESVAVAASTRVVASIVSPLLDNAFRHAASCVEVKVHPHSHRVVVEVLDDGPGFSPDQVEQVFAAGTTTGAGNGLGLALARRLAAAAGGEVRAVSDGRGHVQVVLPAV